MQLIGLIIVTAILIWVAVENRKFALAEAQGMEEANVCIE